MRLVSDDGSAVELELVAYQHDEPAVGDEDEWLLVRLTVTTERGAVSSDEPSLTTGEVERLSAWLESSARGAVSERELDFLEPDLRLELLGDEDERIRLRVWLEDGPGDDLWIDLLLDRVQLAAAAESLRAELRTFPARLAWGGDDAGG